MNWQSFISLIQNKTDNTFFLSNARQHRVIGQIISALLNTNGGKLIIGYDKVNVHLTGYRPYCKPQFKNSSGVTILIKNELLEGTEIIKTTDNFDYLICKLKKDFFKQPKDIYIVNIYIRPHDSSANTIDNNGKEAFNRIE